MQSFTITQKEFLGKTLAFLSQKPVKVISLLAALPPSSVGSVKPRPLSQSEEFSWSWSWLPRGEALAPWNLPSDRSICCSCWNLLSTPEFMPMGWLLWTLDSLRMGADLPGAPCDWRAGDWASWHQPDLLNRSSGGDMGTGDLYTGVPYKYEAQNAARKLQLM